MLNYERSIFMLIKIIINKPNTNVNGFKITMGLNLTLHSIQKCIMFHFSLQRSTYAVLSNSEEQYILRNSYPNRMIIWFIIGSIPQIHSENSSGSIITLSPAPFLKRVYLSRELWDSHIPRFSGIRHAHVLRYESNEQIAWC